MTSHSQAEDSARQIPPWLFIVKFLLLAAFVILVLLLGLSMTGHRFFRGGRIDNHGVLRP